MKKILIILAVLIGVVVIAVTTITIINVVAQNIPPSTKRPTFDKQMGATAQCKDGVYSYSTARAGTCSGHGGVQTWFE